MPEQRKSHRLDIVLPAWFHSDDTQNLLSTATTINISSTGICLSCGEKIDIGKELPVTVTLPTGERAVIGVKVIWIRDVENTSPREYRIGLKIMDADKSDEKKFIKFYSEKKQNISER